MDDESPPRVAADRAWTIYLAAHADVDAADHRRWPWSVTYMADGKRANAILKN
jgi:hypothetical protein